MKALAPSLIISMTIILSAYLIGNAYQKRGKTSDSISVTGLGEENFVSDLIVWRAGFSQRKSNLKEAYQALKDDRTTIQNYLVKKGISPENIIFMAVNINKEFDQDYDEMGNLRKSIFTGYNLSQEVKVESTKVDLVESISREATELIDLGLELYSHSPEYFYTKLNQLKIKMIEAATSDARSRAEKIAKNAGGDLGKLKKADLGVFQITGQNSSEEYQWGGSFNTHEKAKTARVTIRLNYEIN